MKKARVLFVSQDITPYLDETYVDNEVYEIYFYDKRTIDFQSMIHEQIFLHLDLYPILDADSKLEGVDTPEA
jgi:hypothetical protein